MQRNVCLNIICSVLFFYGSWGCTQSSSGTERDSLTVMQGGDGGETVVSSGGTSGEGAGGQSPSNDAPMNTGGEGGDHSSNVVPMDEPECESSEDCRLPSAPICRSGQCGPCLTDRQCEDKGFAVCSQNGRCKECSRHADCPDERPLCLADQTCAECQGDNECGPLEPLCIFNECRSCTEGECTQAERTQEFMTLLCKKAAYFEDENFSPDHREIFEVCFGDPLRFKDRGFDFSVIESSGVEVTQEVIEQCRSIQKDNASEVITACLQLLEPQIENGGTCYSNLECQSGRCLGEQGQCGKTCTPLGEEWAPCDQDTDCHPHFYCDDRNRCQARFSELNESCNIQRGDNPCLENLVCDRDRLRCREPFQQEDGGRCDSPLDCMAGLECVDGQCDGDDITALNEPCDFDRDCTDGAFCLHVDWRETRCLLPATAGQICRDEKGCEEGLICNWNSGRREEGVCGPPNEPGEGCSFLSGCTQDSICLNQRCTRFPEAGQACLEEQICSPGLVCHPQNRICTEPRGENAPCFSDEECESPLFCLRGWQQENLENPGVCKTRSSAGDYCGGRTCMPEQTHGCGTQHCDFNLRCVNETCVELISEGSACERTSDCDWGHLCKDQICRPIQARGQRCSNITACALGTRCHNGICQPIPDIGEACDENSRHPCLRGRCVDNLCQDAAQGEDCALHPLTYSYGGSAEVFDPCGASLSCLEVSRERDENGAWIVHRQCLGEGQIGDECTGVFDNRPCYRESYCSSSDEGTGLCEPRCITELIQMNQEAMQ